jgi:hypothetical protein
MPEDDNISKLLRLKRYEQPPPEYFENFLCEFNRRQRAELLRRPAWRIALDRLEALVNNITLSQMSYGTATVAVLAVAGYITIGLVQHPGTSAPQLLAAHTTSVASSSPAGVAPSVISGGGLQTVAATSHEFSLTPRIRFPEPFPSQLSVQPGTSSQHPRYVLDARPVSYEPPFSF